MSTLTKSLGLFRLTVYGVGTIIGSGIYAVISPAAATAGSGIWISFIIAAFVSMFTAFSYAELASALPSAGAEHNFLKKAFPKLPIIAFVVGCFIAIHGAATIGAVALTFADYLNQFVKLPSAIVAVVVIVLLTLVNVSGLKKASWINVSFTVTQVACLLILIFAGFSSDQFSGSVEKILTTTIDWNGTLGASAIVFFIYTGYEHMASLSEEAANPDKDLWKAFLFALLITTAIYLGVIVSILGLLSPDEIAKSSGPLAVAGERRWSLLGPAITGAALLATANGVLSGSLSVSRLLFGMARAGDLPKALSQIGEKSKTPWLAAFVVMIAACVLVFLGSLELVASLSSFGALLVFALVNSAVIALRITKPDLRRPFKIPGSIGRWPLLPAFGALASVLLATRYQGMVYSIFIGAIILAMIPYLIQKKSRR